MAEETSRISIVGAVVSGAVVALLLGYLIVLAVGTDDPPLITARVVDAEVRQRGGATYVPVEVANGGTLAAAMVILETGLDGGADETTTTTIDFLAGGESRRVYAVLPTASGAGPAWVRVRSYQEP